MCVCVSCRKHVCVLFSLLQQPIRNEISDALFRQLSNREKEANALATMRVLGKLGGVPSVFPVTYIKSTGRSRASAMVQSRIDFKGLDMHRATLLLALPATEGN
jgi:hypothetical protein